MILLATRSEIERDFTRSGLVRRSATKANTSTPFPASLHANWIHSVALRELP
jgi:hypothetical protein